MDELEEFLREIRNVFRKDPDGEGVILCNCDGKKVREWMDQVDALLEERAKI